jgi:hypothetical protein
MPAIKATLWLTSESAVSRNWLRLLSAAVATLPTARIRGWRSMILVSATVNSLVRSSKPGAMTLSTNAGVKTWLTSTTRAKAASKAVRMRFVSRNPARSPSSRDALRSTGIIALESAPPAIRLKSVSGRRKAA